MHAVLRALCRAVVSGCGGAVETLSPLRAVHVSASCLSGTAPLETGTTWLPAARLSASVSLLPVSQNGCARVGSRARHTDCANLSAGIWLPTDAEAEREARHTRREDWTRHDTKRDRWSHCSGDSGMFSTSASHAAADASAGMRQSPRGDSAPPEPTLGPSGMQSRLN